MSDFGTKRTSSERPGNVCFWGGLNEGVPENIPRTLVQARSLAQSKSNVEANDQTRGIFTHLYGRRLALNSLESACERVANVIKEGQQLLARNGRRADAHDRDER